MTVNLATATSPPMKTVQSKSDVIARSKIEENQKILIMHLHTSIDSIVLFKVAPNKPLDPIFTRYLIPARNRVNYNQKVKKNEC